ncbi:MAG: sugar porter family MFS transporter [Planctomycetaceae bacterium]|nr:sugar porter family MFS transporter [Planctomycetaceae bacterium]
MNVKYITGICFVATMGGLLFGYDWVVIGGAKPFFEKYFEIQSEHVRGWVNSCALLGCLLGALGTGPLSERLGRKKMLLLAAVLFAASSLLTGWAWSFNAFVFWRIVGGVAIGMAAALSPVYIAEVAPAEYRGRLVALNQMAIVIGILMAQIVNWRITVALPPGELILDSWYVQYSWRWMFSIVAIPSVAFFVGACLIPESPRWLVKAGRTERARKIFARIGGKEYADAEIANVEISLQQTDTKESTAKTLSGYGKILQPGMLLILMTGCVLAVLQQWSGINVIFNYAEEIFGAAGYDVKSILFTIVFTGTVNFLATIVAILTVDRFGRRKLMLLGCAGIALGHFLTATACVFGFKGMIVVAPVLLALIFYALSLAPVTWVLIAEIFPNKIRSEAVAISTAALWIACFILTYTFPSLTALLGMAGTFALYAVICLAGFVFVAYRVPETKGKTLEQIEQELLKG